MSNDLNRLRGELKALESHPSINGKITLKLRQIETILPPGEMSDPWKDKVREAWLLYLIVNSLHEMGLTFDVHPIMGSPGMVRCSINYRIMQITGIGSASPCAAVLGAYNSLLRSMIDDRKIMTEHQ